MSSICPKCGQGQAYSPHLATMGRGENSSSPAIVYVRNIQASYYLFKCPKNSSSEPYIPRSLAFSCNEVPSILPSAVQNTNYLGPSRPPFAQDRFPPLLIMVYQGKSYPNCIQCIHSCWSEAYRSKNAYTRQHFRSMPSRIIPLVFYAPKTSLSLFTYIILPN